MTLNLSDHVSGGEIVNTRKNSVHGYLALRAGDRPIVLQLTGNCSDVLAGLHIRFEANPQPSTDSVPMTEDQFDELHLAWMQIGVPGKMTVTNAISWLYLEWYGQNGHTVVDLKDAVISVVSDEEIEADLIEDSLDFDSDLDAVDSGDDLEDELLGDDQEDDLDDESGTQIASFERTDDPDAEPWNRSSMDDADDDDEDPFGLFPPDLEASLGSSSPPWSSEPDEGTLAQWKEWDEVFDGTKDVPLSSLFDPPIQLPPASSLDDEQVAALFNTILKQLALHNVAFHMCEHFTPRKGYTLLVEEILREYGTHPELPRIGYTMNFDTAESCDECTAEFERRHAERKNEENTGETGFDPLNDEEMPF